MGKEKFTFFWGGPLSNFYTSYFTDAKGVSYSCTEQYYMAMKALFFKDDFRYKMIIAESNPKKIKKHGRSVENYSDESWYGSEEEDILTNPAKKHMYDANFLKYSQNEKLLKILKESEGSTLVEASPYDRRWGIGMSYCAVAKHRRFWKGKNWLGEVLTKVREDIMAKESKSFLF